MSEKRSSDGMALPSDLPQKLSETMAAEDTSLRAVDPDEVNDDGPDDAEQTQSVEDYANRAGRVNHEKLHEAIRDWQSSTIDRVMLDEVIEVFRTGERVVEKEVITIEERIDTDRTLERNPNSDQDEAVVYRVPNEINVTANLTIEPGVVMEFAEGASLELTADSGSFGDPGYGALIAEGTPNDPILLTGTRPRHGWWDSVTIDTLDPRNTMSQVIVEYGGQTGNSGDDDGKANVRIEGGKLGLSECELRQSGAYGLALSEEDAKLLDHEGEGSGSNSYLGNRSGPVYTKFENVHMLSADSTYTSPDPLRRNDKEYVFVDGGSVSGRGRDQEERTMGDLGVPYRVDGSVSVDRLTWTIKPGTTLEFTEESGFSATGRFVCQGTAAAPIRFTGVENEPGWWGGITGVSDDSGNVMEHCIVEYGGGGGRDASFELHGGQLKMHDCTVRDSASYGINIEDTNIDGANNVYTDNAEGPALVTAASANQLSEMSEFTGNDNDYVYVSPQEIDGDDVIGEFTWDGLDVPYRMAGEGYEINRVEWTIEPGATLEFEEGGWLDLDSTCELSFEGEPGNEITFTGTQEQRGWWGTLFVETDSSANTLRHAVVEYGGNGFGGGVRMDGGTTLHIEHCTFRHNDGYGLYTGEATLEPGGKEMRENVYTDNADGAVRTRTQSVNQLSDTSEFTGNDDDHVYVKGGVDTRPGRVTGELTWEGLGVPYRLSGDENRIFDLEWTVEAGTTVEAEEGARIQLTGDSAFRVEGEDGDEITFTGTQEQRGWWDGLKIGSDAVSNTLRHTVVEYAGNSLPGGVRMDSGSTAHIEHCTFRHNSGYGLHTENVTLEPLEKEMQENVYTNNAEGAVRTRMPSTSQLSDTSEFTGNDDDHVYVKGGADVRRGRVTGEFTWDTIDVPYRVSGEEHRFFDLDWTIEPGATVEIEENGGFNLQGGCKLTFEGEPGNEITFTGTANEQGWWQKLDIKSYSQTNTMVHTVVENGGGGGGGVVRLDDGRFSPMENCTIRMSASEGLYVQSNATDQINDTACEVNTFEDNAGPDCYFEN